MWRFNTLFISGNNIEKISDSIRSKESNTGFGIAIGKEYRKKITNDFEMRLGADLFFRYNQRKSNNEDDRIYYYDYSYKETTYSPGINFVFGFNYIISKSIVVGAELLPAVNYVFGTSVQKRSDTYSNVDENFESDISGFNYGLSNSSILLSLTYRFK